VNKRRTWLGNLRFAIVLILWVLGARAEDLPPPTFDSMIGGLLPSGHHSYITESHLELPLFHVEPLTISYRYGETTPFLKENAQAELLYTRYDLEADLKLCDFAQLIAIGGYRGMQLEDRPGSLSAYAVGAGLGSPWRRERAWLEWSVLVGTYLSRERLNADWWADLHAVWIVHQFSERQVIETTNYPALGLALDIESANEDEAFHARYRIGPVLDIVSANGNQIRFQARWYRTDGDPFYQDRDTGLLLGVEVDALLDKDKLFNAREDRPVGLLPLVWGQYNIGYGDERMVEEFELDAEIHDYMIGDHLLTGVLWYQSRQEQGQRWFSITCPILSVPACRRLLAWLRPFRRASHWYWAVTTCTAAVTLSIPMRPAFLWGDSWSAAASTSRHVFGCRRSAGTCHIAIRRCTCAIPNG
jgi:hypothetical protein